MKWSLHCISDNRITSIGSSMFLVVHVIFSHTTCNIDLFSLHTILCRPLEIELHLSTISGKFSGTLLEALKACKSHSRSWFLRQYLEQTKNGFLTKPLAYTTMCWIATRISLRNRSAYIFITPFQHSSVAYTSHSALKTDSIPNL